MRSDTVKVIVTDRPRIAKLAVEYNFPAYVRRASVVQPRSDGNLDTLYGSSVLLTIAANKPLKSVLLTGSFVEAPVAFSVGGAFAQGVIRIDRERWLRDERPVVEETYTLCLTDEFGYANERAERPYVLTITKDRGPLLEFTGQQPARKIPLCICLYGCFFPW